MLEACAAADLGCGGSERYFPRVQDVDAALLAEHIARQCLAVPAKTSIGYNIYAVCAAVD